MRDASILAKETGETAKRPRGVHGEGSECAGSRRDFLSWVGNGLFSASLASLLLRDNLAGAAVVPGESKESCPHFLPKAKRAIHICLCGAMSQVDTFDYKPELAKFHGKSLQSMGSAPDIVPPSDGYR